MNDIWYFCATNSQRGYPIKLLVHIDKDYKKLYDAYFRDIWHYLIFSYTVDRKYTFKCYQSDCHPSCIHISNLSNFKIFQISLNFYYKFEYQKFANDIDQEDIVKKGILKTIKHFEEVVKTYKKNRLILSKNCFRTKYETLKDYLKRLPEYYYDIYTDNIFISPRITQNNIHITQNQISNFNCWYSIVKYNRECVNMGHNHICYNQNCMKHKVIKYSRDIFEIFEYYCSQKTKIYLDLKTATENSYHIIKTFIHPHSWNTESAWVTPSIQLLLTQNQNHVFSYCSGEFDPIWRNFSMVKIFINHQGNVGDKIVYNPKQKRMTIVN